MKDYAGPNTLLSAFRIIRQAIKSVSLSAGDGLTKTGDTISVTNPNRGILTQAEYDALTPEQKASGTYFVDDGGGGGSGSAGEAYSTEERRIGTWIDGKPLYQRTFFAHTKESTYTVEWKILNIQIENVDKIVGISATILSSDGFTIPLPYAIGNSTTLLGYSDANSGSICTLCMNAPTLENRPFEATFRYTKTTDEAIISTGEGGTT